MTSGALLTSCSDDSEDRFDYFYGPYTEFADIETIDGSTVTYSVYPDNSDLEITFVSYQSNYIKPEETPVGSRVFLSYNITSQVTSPNPDQQAIQLIGCQEALMADVVDKEPEASTIEDAKFYIVGTPYRGGKYANIECTLPGQEKRSFICYLDPATLNSSLPQLYLKAKTQQPAESANADSEIKTTFYPISIDLSKVWAKTGATAVSLNVETASGQQTFRFSR